MIPAQLAKRPRHGEYPIPVTTLVKNGVPDFRTTDMDVWNQVVVGELCALCGEQLDYWKWFIGGPSCFETRLFFDAAMHEPCARYAMEVCPFLTMARGYSQRPLLEGTEIVVKVNPKPSDRLGLGRTRRYSLIQKGKDLFIHTTPFVYVEWWKNGKREQ